MLADRVKETGTVSGTGNITLTGAVTAYRSFSAAFPVGSTVWYAVDDGTNYEVGHGVLTSATNLTRATVVTSSNNNALVTFPANTLVSVINTAPARAVGNTARDIALIIQGVY